MVHGSHLDLRRRIREEEARLIAKRGRNTLVIVHRTPLLDQWIAQLGVFLDLDPAQIGQIGGGKRKAGGVVDVAMIQSLVRRGEVDPIAAEYGHVVVDECHHVPAVSFERVMHEVRARFVTGLTATPRRRDGHHPILRFQIGPVRTSVDPKQLASSRPFGHRVVVRRTGFKMRVSKRLTAALEHQRDVEEISTRSVVSDSEGLTPHEIVGSVSVASYPPTPVNPPSYWMIQQDMGRAGYTDIAVTLAVRGLLKKGLIQEVDGYDPREGDKYEALIVSDSGLVWLESNQEKLVLKKKLESS